MTQLAIFFAGTAGSAATAASYQAASSLSLASTPGVSARLTSVPASTPIGALQGTRNLVSFTTRRYRTEPLVISGPGAGAEVTAAGILNDIYSLTSGSGQ